MKTTEMIEILDKEYKKNKSFYNELFSLATANKKTNPKNNGDK